MYRYLRTERHFGRNADELFFYSAARRARAGAGMEFGSDQARQPAQDFRLRGVELARFVIDDENAPRRVALLVGDRRAGLQAEVRRAFDRRTVGEPGFDPRSANC